jgi:CBS-domain-containing membrane protein
MNLVRGVVHWFDLFGEPIAPLNIKGQTKLTTIFGGVVGMLVTGLILWFLETRLVKMVTLDDAIMAEVT